MFGRKGLLVVLAALAFGAGGCAWDTGDEAVYYEHAPKHELGNGAIDDPSGLGTTPDKNVASPATSGTPVQSGDSRLSQPQPEPEPQPWVVIPVTKSQYPEPIKNR